MHNTHAVVFIFIYSLIIRIFPLTEYPFLLKDPDSWFNYKITSKIQNNIFYFFRWNDSMVWCPEGRKVSEYVYPGVSFVSLFLKYILELFCAKEINTVIICCITCPVFGSFSSVLVYYLSRLVYRHDVGVLAAVLYSSMPNAIEKSRFGMYDNEAIAIFFILMCFLFLACMFIYKNQKIYLLLPGILFFYCLYLGRTCVCFKSNCTTFFIIALLVFFYYSIL